MPTDEERREYPHLSDEEREDIEKVRALKARDEWPLEPRGPDPPTFEEQALTLLRELSELLREIRDHLRSLRAGRDGRRGE